MEHRILGITWSVVCFTFAAFCFSAVAADKGADPKRLQQQLRAAERDKAQLTAKKAEIEAQLKQAQDAIVGAKQKAESAQKKNSTLTHSMEALRLDKEALAAKGVELQGLLDGEQKKVAELERRLTELTRQRQEQQRSALAEQERLKQALNASRERNERMYRLGFELIDRYERTAVSQAEPFIGIKRAQIEKMAEEDRDKFAKDRLPP